MQEEFLHYIWKYKRFNQLNLVTESGQSLNILSPGQHNHDSGPDFFNAKIIIGDQVWAGNIEIHVKSSDWFKHNHQFDLAYDSVILHVVWDNDADVKRNNGALIETVQLKNNVDNQLLTQYKGLMNSRSWINCEKDFKEVDSFVLENWLERLYIERVDQKSRSLDKLLNQNQNNWEHVLFISLFRSFGLKINADAFESCARSIDFSVIQKTRSDPKDLESLFFGQFGLLDQNVKDTYFLELKERYNYLSHKFKILRTGVIPLKWSRLRPGNFPTIRIAQFSQVLSKKSNLFSILMSSKILEDFYTVFDVSTSSYWDNHYNFGTASNASNKRLTPEFVNLLIINAISPIKFLYFKSIGQLNFNDVLSILAEIPFERNSVTSRFKKLKPLPENAISSQGLLQLKGQYCDNNACLSCAIAHHLIL
ncbi:DUF2851 family protein [Winogradskyella aurantiaca]|uniref:DUF2851 family protein n=1 Tax=Winogradskyella aurantiaca TaxID=2219558 RepID=UPI000E1C9FE0|nr:DUF2851 family protein [Winogradskyella aurantiaca]